MIFVTPTTSDFETLLGWFTSQQALTLWGGPGLSYPMDVNLLQQAILGPDRHTRVLKDEDDTLLAFGQFSIRLGRHHFGRLAVSPAIRGRGLGKQLVAHLLEEAPKVQDASGASLFVYEDNVPAVKCYTSMGFKQVPYPDPESGAFNECLYMIRV